MNLFGGVDWPRRLAVGAAVLGVLAPVAGSPYAAHHGRVDVQALARTVEQQDDHVTAVELARWIKERRRGLRIVDVRAAAEFDAYHLPGAERIALGALADVPFRADETIVLYSEAGAHAAQGWVFLRALGHARVYFLRGGLNEWLDDVMNPVLAADATAGQRATFDSTAELSRYFGGVPQRAPEAGSGTTDNQGPRTETKPMTTSLQRVRKRGC